MSTYNLDGILDALNQRRQRATYGAVAALVGRTPRLLMHGRPRERNSSWIVSRSTGRPTGYADGEVHPDLMTNEKILETREELETWLATQ